MSFPFGLNVLTFSDVVKQLRTTFETFSDRRTGKNTNYTMTDAGLSAFSVFFMQSPSFLEFQRTMQETQGKNNAQTLFGVFQIPTDNHIRTLLDAVEPAAVYPLFDFVFDGFQRAGVIDSFRSTDNRLLRHWMEPNTFPHKSSMVPAVHAKPTAMAKSVIRTR